MDLRLWFNSLKVHHRSLSMPGCVCVRKMPHWISSSKPKEIKNCFPGFGTLVCSCGCLHAWGDDTTRLGNGTLVRTVLLAPIQAMGNGTVGRTLEIAPTPCPPINVIGTECIDPLICLAPRCAGKGKTGTGKWMQGEQHQCACEVML